MVDRKNLLSVLRYDEGTGLFHWTITDRAKRAGSVAGSLNPSGYVNIGVFGKTYKAHRLAWLYVHGHWPSGQIDHINRNRLDNRILNLRDVTSAENNHNRSLSKKSSSGIMGASWHPSARGWQSNIRSYGKLYYLGIFPTAIAAGEAYQAAKLRLHLPKV